MKLVNFIPVLLSSDNKIEFEYVFIFYNLCILDS
jgi:hypothetical protein